MGHCVGGYCDAVEGGETRILSLRDDEGKSRVTIELQKGGNPFDDDTWVELTNRIEQVNPTIIEDNAMELYDLSPQAQLEYLVSKGYGDQIREVVPNLDEILSQEPIWEIHQVKGPGNRKPRKEDMPYIHDFIRETGYPIVGDEKHADMINLKDWDGEGYFPDKYVTKDEAERMIRQYQDEVWAPRAAKDTRFNPNPNLDNWITEVEKYLGPYEE
jgi:hypothetical protein